MAAIYVCDGCGSSVEKPVQVGFVLKRDYCEPCAAKAREFQDSVEVLLQKARGEFMAARNEMVQAAGNFKLPDVP